MSAEKRTVSTDALETLGNIIEGGGRDAIHLAVEPVSAGEILVPGQHVGLKNGNIATTEGKLLGIVDPFLSNPIQVGEKFWLIVYPRQITSLRHVWTHPDFEESVDTNSKQDSVKWMTDWARQHMSADYYGDYDEKVSDEQALANAIKAGHNHHLGPYEGADDTINDTWWFHWEKITGQIGDREGYFSCSC